MSSTSGVIELTEEQEKFLSDLEEEFKDRYTENDAEFKAVLDERLPPPPIIENWGDFRQRNERNERYTGGRNRDFRVHPYHRRLYVEEHPYDRHRDRCYRDDGERYSRSSRHEHRYKM